MGAGNPILNARGDELLYGGDIDPSVDAVDAPIGSFYVFEGNAVTPTPAVFQKQDNGSSTNWTASGMNLDFSNHTASAVDIDLGTHKLVNVVDPTVDQDGATKKYVDDQVGAASHMQTNFSNSIASTVNIDLGTNKIINLVDPTADQEASTKKYVDDQITAIPAGANTTLSNLTAGVAVNRSLEPTDLNRSLGNDTLGWNQIFGKEMIAGNTATDGKYRIRVGSAGLSFRSTWELNEGKTLPSGNTADIIIQTNSFSGVAHPLAIYTENEGVNDAAASASMFIETGNKTAGTGDSGSIGLQTGTTVGGARGGITFNALITDMSLVTDGLIVPLRASDPSTPADGTIWYRTDTDKLRLRANGATVDLN